MTPRFLIVGLGNPGREYREHRHNVGYMVLDTLARRHAVDFTRLQSRALLTDFRLDGAVVMLAKPQTYMNRSGGAVAELRKFYDLPLDQLLIVFDDIDLPTGMLRMRPQGGSAGQNGMKSIIARLGTQSIPRLRIGVDRPPGRMAAAAYVLRPFSSEQAEIIAAVLPHAADAVEAFVREGIDYAMNRFNGPATE